MLERKLPDFYFIRIEQAEIVTFRQKAFEAPSVVKTKQQPLLKQRSTQLSKECVDLTKKSPVWLIIQIFIIKIIFYGSKVLQKTRSSVLTTAFLLALA